MDDNFFRNNQNEVYYVKQTKHTNCILLSDMENPLINQIIVMLKEDVITPQDEAVEISRAIVNNCIKNYHSEKKSLFKKLIPGIFCLALGIVIGFFI